jgi:hypothetical protein
MLTSAWSTGEGGLMPSAAIEPPTLELPEAIARPPQATPAYSPARVSRDRPRVHYLSCCPAWMAKDGIEPPTRGFSVRCSSPSPPFLPRTRQPENSDGAKLLR